VHGRHEGASLFSGSAHIGETLTVATSASYVVGVVAGHVLLTRRIGSLRLRPVARTVARAAVAAAVGGCAAWGVLTIVDQTLGRGHSGAVVGLVGGGLVAAAVYVVVALRLRVGEISDVLGAVRGR
jgi:putative peptidoglycan lipid II flippase